MKRNGKREEKNRNNKRNANAALKEKTNKTNRISIRNQFEMFN